MGRRRRHPIGFVIVVVLVLVTSACSEEGGGLVPTTGLYPDTTAAGLQATTVTTPEDQATTPLTSSTLTPTTSTVPPSTTSTTLAPTTTTTPPPTPTTTRQPPTTTLPPPEPVTFEALKGVHTIRDFAGYTSSGMRLWDQSVPGIEEIGIESSADGAQQPALWLPATGERPRPLLVILHSWSSNYLQHAGIPYAMWAEENGWAVIAPNFRGVNDDAQAIGSDLAVQDVVDAIAHATAQPGVDPERVYAVGYSGGGMMALLVAGRHPEAVSAVAAWGPPHDLVEFYRQSASAGRGYAWDITTACGGDPTGDAAARDECLSRSPVTHLRGAEGRVSVFIAQGIFDSLLWPSHGVNAFNQLARPADRLDPEQIDRIRRGALPDELAGSLGAETFFGEGDPRPVFARRSGATWLVLFNSGHDMAYQATARWLAELATA